jgi:hypothetical protein
MRITVTWITPREYSATIDERQLRDAVSGTSRDQEVSRLLDRVVGGQVLDDEAMLRLAAALEDHPSLLAAMEDDEHWASTGELEVTHVGREPCG